MHFEFKLSRQALTENRTPIIDTRDILDLNNLDNDTNRAYTLVIGSKSENLNLIIDSVKKEVKDLNNQILKKMIY
jgi:chemotaxis signal transduction protein